MGVQRVNGPGQNTLPSSATVRPATPRSRTADTGTEAAPAARARPGPSQDQDQSVAESADPTPVVRRAGTRLRVDETSQRVVAQIVDQNNEVIKQIPPEEALKIAARFREVLGKLFDQKV
jgi:uncharacterized FlaG/YvyC family protein